MLRDSWPGAGWRFHLDLFERRMHRRTPWSPFFFPWELFEYIKFSRKYGVNHRNSCGLKLSNNWQLAHVKLHNIDFRNLNPNYFLSRAHESRTTYLDIRSLCRPQGRLNFHWWPFWLLSLWLCKRNIVKTQKVRMFCFHVQTVVCVSRRTVVLIYPGGIDSGIVNITRIFSFIL